MPTEEDESETKTPSISSRTRSQTRQDPIVTAQDADDIFQSSSSSKADSEVSGFEDSDIEQTEQYNPRTLQFPTTTTTTTTEDAMAPSSPFDAELLYIFTDVLKIDMTKKPLHSIPAGILHYGVTEWDNSTSSIQEIYLHSPIQRPTIRARTFRPPWSSDFNFY